MRYLKVKDKKKRKFFNNIEIKQLLCKSILFDLSLTYNIRSFLFLIMQKYNRYSKVKIRNRCVISNRSRYIFTKYKVSRLAFKRLVVLRLIPGVYRCIW